jgi:hypothetical protein
MWWRPLLAKPFLMLFFIVAFGNMMGTFLKLWEPIEKSREYSKNTIKTV